MENDQANNEELRKVLKQLIDDEKKEQEDQNDSSTTENVAISKPYNKTGIIGFALSIISIFGIGLAGLAGAVLGIVALTQIKHTQERGKGFAIAAIVIGIIWSFGTGILNRLIEMGY